VQEVPVEIRRAEVAQGRGEGGADLGLDGVGGVVRDRLRAVLAADRCVSVGQGWGRG